MVLLQSGMVLICAKRLSMKNGEGQFILHFWIEIITVKIIVLWE